MRFLVLIFALFLSACGKAPLVQTKSYVFGTLVDISIDGETEEKAHEVTSQILQDFQRLHHQYHAWQSDSELSKLNQSFVAGKTPIEISPELSQMLTQAQTLSKQSQGLFNPSIGGLISTWGFQRDEFTPVEINDAAIQKLVLANPQMSDIVIKGNAVFSTNPAVKLDLGGYAKGYALDLALTQLQKQGVKNALINIGGNIIALGQHGDKPWRVGIQHPRQPKPMATIDLLSGWAIGTSGDYQRYFEQGGNRYCHIIDPRNGYPAQGTQAVTVLLPPSPQAGVLSDVTSKPIFLSSPDQRSNAAKTMGVEHYLVIDGNGNVTLSASMNQRLRWLAKPPKITVQ
jgi:thiamine biosynthesis lipoprotein